MKNNTNPANTKLKTKEKVRISMKTLLENNRVLQIFCLLLSFLCWIGVVIMENPDRKHTIEDVPVTISTTAQNLTEMGLSVIEGADTLVDVTVNGPWTVVGNLTPDRLVVTAGTGTVTGPGYYELPLTLTNLDDLREVDVESFSPSTIRVRFDRLVPRTLEILPNTRGLSTAPNLVVESERVYPDSITITGPQSDIDRVEQASIEVELLEPLERSYVSDELPIRLLDAQGEVIDPSDYHLTMDQDTAQLIVRVLKIKTLPLEVELINAPASFPLDDLLRIMDMSVDEIEIAGPVDVMDSFMEVTLGYIDLNTLSPDNTEFIFDVELPESFVNMNNITSVAVSFDSEDWETQRFNVNTDNVDITNVPSGYEASILTSSINNITVVGKGSILQNLTADDIVVVADLSEREIQPGQFTYPVKVSIPTKGLAWAVGDYTVIIQMTEE